MIDGLVPRFRTRPLRRHPWSENDRFTWRLQGRRPPAFAHAGSIRPIGAKRVEPRIWPHRGLLAAISLHIRVIGAAAPFGGNPRDVVVRILDVAGLAVDAVLGVDHKPEILPLSHPFIDSGRAITIRRAGIYVVLGGLL